MKIIVDLDEDIIQRLQALKDRMKKESNEQVVSDSLWLYNWLMGRVENGEKFYDKEGIEITIFNDNGTFEF